MKVLRTPLRAALVLAAGLALTACTTTTTVTRSAPTPYNGPVTTSGQSLSDQLQWQAANVNRDIVFVVGDCKDETGQHKDADALRYSTAVTQACQNLLVHIVRNSGFRVVERNPFNLGIIAQEYAMGHQFGQVVNPLTGQTETRNIGLIQRNAPEGGLVGANYMVTGSISSYSTSVQTGGGGADVDGIGFSMRNTLASASVTLHLVDVRTSEVVSSMDVQTDIRGTTMSYHFTRVLGAVSSTLASVATTPGGTSTVTRPTSSMDIASVEAGSSNVLPADSAVRDGIVSAFARLVEVNQSTFYVQPVRWVYDVPS